MWSKVSLGVFLCLSSFLLHSHGEMLAGGLSSDTVPASSDDPATQLVEKLTPDIRAQASAKLAALSSENGGPTEPLRDQSIVVLSYKTQVVAGLNYFVKAKIGKYIFHLRIFRDLKGNASLHAIRGPLQDSAPIDYFA